MTRQEHAFRKLLLAYISDQLDSIRGQCSAERGEHYNRGYRDALYNVRMTMQNIVSELGGKAHG